MPSLWLLGAQRERSKESPTRGTREQDSACNHVFLRSRDLTENERQGDDDPANQAPRDHSADVTCLHDHLESLAAA
jgi:hypothetical protein